MKKRLPCLRNDLHLAAHAADDRFDQLDRGALVMLSVQKGDLVGREAQSLIPRVS